MLVRKQENPKFTWVLNNYYAMSNMHTQQLLVKNTNYSLNHNAYFLYVYFSTHITTALSWKVAQDQIQYKDLWDSIKDQLQ